MVWVKMITLFYNNVTRLPPLLPSLFLQLLICFYLNFAEMSDAVIFLWGQSVERRHCLMLSSHNFVSLPHWCNDNINYYLLFKL